MSQTTYQLLFNFGVSIQNGVDVPLFVTRNGRVKVGPKRDGSRGHAAGKELRVLVALGADLGLGGVHRAGGAVREHHLGGGVEGQHLSARPDLQVGGRLWAVM